MTISVMTNIASLVAQQSLNGATDRMNTAMERLATGYKIINSKDDPAGSAVSSKLEYEINSLKTVTNNIQFATSFLDVEDSILEIFRANLTRIRDLTEQAANGTCASDSLTAIAQEVQARMDEISRLANITEFDGLNLLNGSITEDLSLQVGTKADENNVIILDKSLFESAEASILLNIKGKTAADMYKDDNTAREFLNNVDAALGLISNKVTQIGGIYQRLNAALEAIDSMSTYTMQSKAAIKDADIAAEVSNYAKEQILQQVSTSMLSTANQAPSMALNLL